MKNDNPGVILPPPVIYLAALTLGFAFHVALPASMLPVALARPLGIGLITGAAAIVVPALRALARARTSFRPDRPTTAIVSDGPFRYTRNPIYVALTLLYVGIALVVNSLWILLLVAPVLAVMQIGVVAREERYLERKFGDEYRRYKTTVRRWL